MKKIGRILVLAAFALVSFSSAKAELAPQWSKGTMMANAVIGVAPFGGAVSIDYVLVDEWWKGHFTVGGEIDFGTPGKHWKAFGVTPRATYGLNITEEFEVHAAAEIGFGHEAYNYDGYKDNNTFMYWNEYVGCRYFFLDNLAATAELGWSYKFPSYRIGITFMF